MDQFKRIFENGNNTKGLKISGDRQCILGKSGKPLRLFTSNGRPVTDHEGRPLTSITGKLLIHYNSKKGVFEDAKGFPLVDAQGRAPSDPDYNPEEQVNVEPKVSPILDDAGRARSIFDLSGYPLTDLSGRPLVNSSGKYMITFDSRGEPVCDMEGKQIIDECEHKVDRPQPLLHPNSGLPLKLFDEDKKPLTDMNGCPFRDIFDKPLIVLDQNGCPMKTTYGMGICDANGRSIDHPDYDPTVKPKNWKLLPPYLDKKGDVKVIFNQRGIPLTDSSGCPLIDSDGNPLLSVNPMNATLQSIDGSELIQISLNAYNPASLKCITNNVGRPARLFNFQGKPLTNWFGEVLKHADGRIMIMFDEQGFPYCDFEGRAIYDECGANLNEKNFKPYESVQMNGELPRLTDALKNGIHLYDGSGMPLTDRRGFYLLNATRNFMIQFDDKMMPISDLRGRKLYTDTGLHLLKNLDEPIIGPKGKPCRLFDMKGSPLTCNDGYALKLLNGEYSIKIDKIGRVISDNKGGMITDARGVHLTNILKFNSHRTPKKPHNKFQFQVKEQTGAQFYDCKGYPLTNSNGESLVNSKGECLIFIDPKDGCLKDRSGQPVYDLKGQLHKGTTSVFKSMEKKKVIIPPSNSSGVKNSSKKITQKKTNKAQILFDGHVQLYDFNNLPLLDNYGMVMESSEGVPLIKTDKNGKIISDYRGKDVYDARGVPLTNVTGFWRNSAGLPLRLFDKTGRPLTDTRGKELLGINKNSLIKRDEFGRPLLDRNGNQVYDADGVCMTDTNFHPTRLPPSNKDLIPTQGLDGKPLIMYDYKGRPLNDEKGTPLVNSNGTSLAMYSLGLESIVDINGNRVYDSSGIPFGCNQDSPIETMAGEPYRLFNKRGAPLTDSNGVPLRFANDLCLLVFDMFGRPIQDTEGDGLYDLNGALLGTPGFRPELATKRSTVCIQKNGSPVRLYDVDGQPLTDRRGFTLVNMHGKSITVDSLGSPILAPDGGKLYDEYGGEYIH